MKLLVIKRKTIYLIDIFRTLTKTLNQGGSHMFEIVFPSLLMIVFLALWRWKLGKIVEKTIFYRNSEKIESILINPYCPDDPEWEEFENKYVKNNLREVKNAA